MNRHWYPLTRSTGGPTPGYDGRPDLNAITMTARQAKQRLRVMTGWAEGKTCKLVGFAVGKRGFHIEPIGNSGAVVAAIGGAGDVIVRLGDDLMYAFWRSHNPMPCRIVLVDVNCTDLDLEDVEALPKITDLGLRFFPHLRANERRKKSAATRLCQPYGEWRWWNFCDRSATLVFGVDAK